MLKHCISIFGIPFYVVHFTDFFLGDQLTSHNQTMVDFVHMLFNLFSCSFQWRLWHRLILDIFWCVCDLFFDCTRMASLCAFFYSHFDSFCSVSSSLLRQSVGHSIEFELVMCIHTCGTVWSTSCPCGQCVSPGISLPIVFFSLFIPATRCIGTSGKIGDYSGISKKESIFCYGRKWRDDRSISCLNDIFIT